MQLGDLHTEIYGQGISQWQLQACNGPLAACKQHAQVHIDSCPCLHSPALHAVLALTCALHGVHAGAKPMGHDAQLLIYALGQQVAEGPCTATKPWGWNVVESAKHTVRDTGVTSKVICLFRIPLSWLHMCRPMLALCCLTVSRAKHGQSNPQTGQYLRLPTPTVEGP